MYIPSKLFPVRIPEPLLKRAKMIVVDRNMKGGVARLICDSLEATLDVMERVPPKFDIVWTRSKGQPATEAEKVACYGGRYRRQMKMGDPLYFPKDWFTSSELMEHFFRSQWDSSTADLIYNQQQVWLSRGHNLVRMPITPPGWRNYPDDATPAATEDEEE